MRIHAKLTVSFLDMALQGLFILVAKFLRYGNGPGKTVSQYEPPPKDLKPKLKPIRTSEFFILSIGDGTVSPNL
jgi:hypothetical protein